MIDDFTGFRLYMESHNVVEISKVVSMFVCTVGIDPPMGYM